MNTATENQTRVLLAIDDNQGYSPEQVSTDLTLGELIASLQEAAAEHGDDALVILNNGQRFGASFGAFRTMHGEIVDITAVDENGEEA